MLHYRRIRSQIIWLFGLVLTSLFVFTQPARADLTLPQTPCDSVLDGLIVNGFSVHLNHSFQQSFSSREDGTKAFGYGGQNNFVRLEGGNIIFDIVTLFASVGPSSGTVKLMGLDQNCNAVFGLGPAYHNLNLLASNEMIYERASYMTTFNGVTRQNAPMVIPKYLWIEVWDGNRNTSFSSYSYLVDIDNLQNPTGTISQPTTEPPGKRPVLIVPGAAGTDLFYDGKLSWPDLVRMSQTNDAFLFNELQLDENGHSINGIETGDIVREIIINLLPDINIFGGLISDMLDVGYVENPNLFVFPYDWRLDINQSNDLLSTKIEQIKTLTGTDKIDIIAHSMGGLLAKNYIYANGSDSINKLVFIGTPHLGSPKAGKALLFGYNFDIPILRNDVMKEFVKNMPSVYQLLPNKVYFDEFHEYIIPFRLLNRTPLNYEDTKNWLIDKGANQLLLDRAEEFFNKDLHNLDLSGIDVYNIAGCRTATQAVYKYTFTNTSISQIGYTSGDGTVPFVSADYGPSTVKYYVNNGTHSELPSLSGVRELILAILNGEQYSAPNISTNTSFCNLRGKTLTWRSPVEVHIYDSSSNHSGPVEGGLENSIPGVNYEIIDGEKFIFLPTDEGQEYRIEAIGLDTGSFDLLITQQENDTEGLTQLFDNVQIVPNSFISFTVSDTSDDSQISFDLDDTTEPEVLTATIFATPDEALVQAISEPEPTPEPQQTSGGVGGPPPSGIYEDKITKIEEDGIILGETLERIPDGTLVLDLSDGRTVYMIGDGKKYGFTSEEAFLGRGFRFSDVIVEYLYNYESGGLITN